jgi:hypothetical protein
LDGSRLKGLCRIPCGHYRSCDRDLQPVRQWRGETSKRAGSCSPPLMIRPLQRPDHGLTKAIRHRERRSINGSAAGRGANGERTRKPALGKQHGLPIVQVAVVEDAGQGRAAGWRRLQRGPVRRDSSFTETQPAASIASAGSRASAGRSRRAFIGRLPCSPVPVEQEASARGWSWCRTSRTAGDNRSCAGARSSRRQGRNGSRITREWHSFHARAYSGCSDVKNRDVCYRNEQRAPARAGKAAQRLAAPHGPFEARRLPSRVFGLPGHVE